MLLIIEILYHKKAKPNIGQTKSHYSSLSNSITQLKSLFSNLNSSNNMIVKLGHWVEDLYSNNHNNPLIKTDNSHRIKDLMFLRMEISS